MLNLTRYQRQHKVVFIFFFLCVFICSISRDILSKKLIRYAQIHGSSSPQIVPTEFIRQAQTLSDTLFYVQIFSFFIVTIYLFSYIFAKIIFIKNEVA